MSSYAFLLKGKQKYQFKNLFVHFEASDDKAAAARVSELLSGAGYDAAHYFKPLRTNLPIVNDLPADSALDDAWCDRYELTGEDGMTWRLKPGQKEDAPAAESLPAATSASLTQRALGAWLFERFELLTREQLQQIAALQHDTDATYAQNLLLACKSPSVRQLEFVYPATVFDLVAAVKTVWPADSAVPAVGLLLQFIEQWISAHNDSAARAEGRANEREEVTAKWVKKYGKATDEKGSVSKITAAGGAAATPAAAADEPELAEEPASTVGEKPEVTATAGEQIHALGDGLYDVSALFAESRFSDAGAAVVVSAEPAGAGAAVVVGAEPAGAGAAVVPPTPAPDYPAYFEPGRYVDLPNSVYHGANGISSTMLKDARVSLLYYHGRHVAKTIVKENSAALSFGSLVHTLTLQPEKLADEFNIEPILPPGAFTTAASMKKAIEAYNESLQPALSIDEIKLRIDAHNGTLRQPFPLGADATETGMLYGMLPQDHQTIPEDQKHTVAAMKAAIKQYNASLPPLLKNSGSREELLAALEIIDPKAAAEERQRPQPVNTSGTKDQLIATIKKIRPAAVFADELYAAWKECDDGRTPVTQKQMRHAKALQSALLSHPTIGSLLQHPGRESEVSYFGFDDDTGLELRVRPDVEINTDGARIGLDLKTISMWGVKADQVKARLHREIINRDYHLSAAMYSDVAGFDQFFWIFINADEDYAWVAIVEASPELLELGRLEYKKTLREIDHAQAVGVWPAPITADYTDELTDYDQHRLEYLQKMEASR